MIEKLSKFKLSPASKVFFILLDIVAIIYTIKNRSSNDFIRYTLIIDVSLLIIIFGFLLFLFNELKTVKPLKKILFPYIFYFLLLGPIYYSLFVLIKDFALKLQSSELPNYLVISITIVITLSLGFILFYFRLRRRSIYGVTEALVGVLIAVEKISSENFHEFSSSNFFLAFLTASVYLVVRGFDNIHQGFTKEPFDPLAKKIHSIFNQKKI